jgi:dihydrofolate synthase/folylpolyglutamate synthase
VISGKSVDDDLLDWGLSEVKKAAQTKDLAPSFFEAMICCAFLLFESEAMDVAVLEVGLGGRLDATNVVSRPLACSIVTIGYDHQAVLGHSLSEIASEKAGIAKPGVPLVVGELCQEAILAVQSHASRINAPIRQFNTHFGSRITDSLAETGVTARFYRDSGEEFEFQCPLEGKYQAHNMALAAEIARGAGISTAICKQGIEKVFWPGRLERLKVGQSEILIDAAHNPQGVEQLVTFLLSHGYSGATIVFGALSGKDWRTMLNLLTRVTKSFWLAEPSSDQAVPCGEIAHYLAERSGEQPKLWNRQYDNLSMEIERLAYSTKIVVCGSIYLMGEIRKRLVVRDRSLW